MLHDKRRCEFQLTNAAINAVYSFDLQQDKLADVPLGGHCDIQKSVAPSEHITIDLQVNGVPALVLYFNDDFSLSLESDSQWQRLEHSVVPTYFYPDDLGTYAFIVEPTEANEVIVVVGTVDINSIEK